MLFRQKKTMKSYKSPSMRREWIEIRLEIDIAGVPHTSPSMRREWIEIIITHSLFRLGTPSPSMRREWIEITGIAAINTKRKCLPPCGGSGLK